MNKWKKVPFSNCSYLPASPCSFAEPPSSSVDSISFCSLPLETANAGDTFARVDLHIVERISKGANVVRKHGELVFLRV